MLFPIVLGAGKRLFADTGEASVLELATRGRAGRARRS